MKYTKVYSKEIVESIGRKQLLGYECEKGYIEIEYTCTGTQCKATGYYATNDRGERYCYLTLREAKQVVETGKSDLDLY